MCAINSLSKYSGTQASAIENVVQALARFSARQIDYSLFTNDLYI